MAWMRSNFTDRMIRPPFDVRTEAANYNTGYFLTASAAFMQNLVYSFIGLRVTAEGLVEKYPPVLPAQ